MPGRADRDCGGRGRTAKALRRRGAKAQQDLKARRSPAQEALVYPSRRRNSGGDLVEARTVLSDDEQPYGEKIALPRQPELGALIVFLAANELDGVEFARRRHQPLAVFDAI